MDFLLINPPWVLKWILFFNYYILIQLISHTFSCRIQWLALWTPIFNQPFWLVSHPLSTLCQSFLFQYVLTSQENFFKKKKKNRKIFRKNFHGRPSGGHPSIFRARSLKKANWRSRLTMCLVWTNLVLNPHPTISRINPEILTENIFNNSLILISAPNWDLDTPYFSLERNQRITSSSQATLWNPPWDHKWILFLIFSNHVQLINHSL
jgi:hypothetical protein